MESRDVTIYVEAIASAEAFGMPAVVVPGIVYDEATAAAERIAGELSGYPERVIEAVFGAAGTILEKLAIDPLVSDWVDNDPQARLMVSLLVGVLVSQLWRGRHQALACRRLSEPPATQP